MTAEKLNTPDVGRECPELAEAWVTTWSALGGFVAQNADGRRSVWFPLIPSAERQDIVAIVPGLCLRSFDQRRAARTAMMAMLDLAGPAAKDAVFGVVASDRKG